MSSSKRITKELAECTTQPPAGVSVALKDEANINVWQVTIRGPDSSPYAGATFGLLVNLPTDYPFKAPNVRFLTRIYHPNVTNDSQGNICLAILKPENWKPATKVSAVLEATRQLLVEPQPDDPLETRIADEYRNEPATFEKNVKDYISRYAKGEPDFSVSAEPAKQAPQRV